MSSAGHVIDAMKRQQKNREMQRYARDKYRSKLTKLYASNSESDRTFDSRKFRTLTQMQKNEVRREVKIEMRKDVLRSLLKTAIILIGLLALILTLYKVA